MRTPLVAGNWKMNKTLEEAQSLTAEVMGMARDEVSHAVTLVLCPPAPYLATVARQLGAGSRISVGAQNCSEHAWGAFTGETSAPMLASAGVQYVILGHSERRQYFGETDSLIARKVDQALAHELVPIFCCGEPLAVREAGTHEALVKEQVQGGLFHLTAQAVEKVVIAYEPVWAIGTGKTASAAQAQEMHAFIRAQLAGRYGTAIAEGIRILYGGSVKADNARELFSQPDVDGGLVGGASLKSREFMDIVKATR